MTDWEGREQGLEIFANSSSGAYAVRDWREKKKPLHLVLAIDLLLFSAPVPRRQLPIAHLTVIPLAPVMGNC